MTEFMNSVEKCIGWTKQHEHLMLMGGFHSLT